MGKNNYRKLTNEELCALIRSGDTLAEEALLAKNRGFLWNLASTFYLQPELGLDRDDLQLEGSFAMLKAAKRFDPTKGVKFLSYAGRAVENAMLDLLRKQDATFERSIPSEKAKYQFQIVKLEDMLPDGQGLRNTHNIPNPNSQNPEKVLLREESLNEIDTAMERLEPREKMYLYYRFGFDDEQEPRRQKETADRCSLTPGRAKKLEAKALEDVQLELPWWYEEENFHPYRSLPE